jgi:hypothetical protein
MKGPARIAPRISPHHEITPRPEISLYRGRTVGLLRRYFRMSMELGRMPSVISRDFFRAKVTSYRMTSFEDVVILVHDVERCLQRLDEASQQAIARVTPRNTRMVKPPGSSACRGAQSPIGSSARLTA